MSSNSTKLAKKLLNEIATSEDTPFETLYYLLEILENKIDPDPEEICIVSELYQLIEKMKLLEERLRKYVKTEKCPGNKLDELYKSIRPFGTSKMYDY